MNTDEAEAVSTEDDQDYFMAMSALMMEWDSEEDELAYGDLFFSEPIAVERVSDRCDTIIPNPF